MTKDYSKLIACPECGNHNLLLLRFLENITVERSIEAMTKTVMAIDGANIVGESYDDDATARAHARILCSACLHEYPIPPKISVTRM